MDCAFSLRHVVIDRAGQDGFVKPGENLFTMLRTASHRLFTTIDWQQSPDRDGPGQPRTTKVIPENAGEARFNQLDGGLPFGACARGLSPRLDRGKPRRSMGEPVQIGNVIGMGVRKQDELDRHRYRLWLSIVSRAASVTALAGSDE